MHNTTSTNAARISIDDFTIDLSKFSSDQQLLIKKMNSVHHLADRTLNALKLIIYDWDINKAVKYYKQDDFCIDYFLDECKNDICPFNLNHKYHFYKQWNNQSRFEFLETMCQYLLYTNKRPKCANLYCFYGHITRFLFEVSNSDEFLQKKCEEYYLKAISLNPKCCDAHSGYGMLLQFVDNLEKSYYHLEMSCSIETDPNISIFCQNYGGVLWSTAQTKEDYEKVIVYAKKAIKFAMKQLYRPLNLVGIAMFKLKKWKECVEYYEKAINTSNRYRINDPWVKYIVVKLYLLALKKQQQDNSQEKNDLKVNDIDDVDDIDDYDEMYANYLTTNGYYIPWKYDFSGIELNSSDSNGGKNIINIDSNDNINNYNCNFKLEYLSYFDEIEITQNNGRLKTFDDIDKLICGFIRSQTGNSYDYNYDLTRWMNKIVSKYFGPPCNQLIFTSIANKNYNGDNPDLSHLYRSIIFNIPLLKSKDNVDGNHNYNYNFKKFEFKIIKSRICDYWLNHLAHSGNKLNFGFTIGVIRFDLNEKIAFNPCFNYNHNYNDNYNVNDKVEQMKNININDDIDYYNPLSLSSNMNLVLGDLITLYSNTLQWMYGMHFSYDKNQDCFIQQNEFEFHGNSYYINSDFAVISKSCLRVKAISEPNNDNSYNDHASQSPIKIKQNDSIVLQCDFDKNVTLMINGEKFAFGSDIIEIDHEPSQDESKYVWLPAVSCVACNCQNCGLILSIMGD